MSSLHTCYAICAQFLAPKCGLWLSKFSRARYKVRLERLVEHQLRVCRGLKRYHLIARGLEADGLAAAPARVLSCVRLESNLKRRRLRGDRGLEAGEGAHSGKRVRSEVALPWR